MVLKGQNQVNCDQNKAVKPIADEGDLFDKGGGSSIEL